VAQVPASPPSTSRGPSALRTLVVVGLVLATLVVVRWSVTGGLTRPLAPPGGPPDTRKPSASAEDLAALRGITLYLGGRQVLLVDAASGAVSSIPSPGAGRVRVLRQGSYMILLARDGGVAAQRADRSSRQFPLGEAIDVLPSPRSDRVWLVTQGETTPDQAYELREVDLASRRALRRWTLPYDAEPVAVVPEGVVTRDLQNSFEVRNPRGERLIRLGRDLTFIDRHGSLIAYLDDRLLHLRDLATGLDRTVPPPAGARSWFALGPPLPGVGCCLQVGAFSPDARNLAVFTELAGPGEPGVTIVDVATGRARVLPGSGGATPLACQPCLGWTDSGWLFFFNGGPALADPAAWRPGERSAIPLSLDLRDATTVLPNGIAPA
jgi:hypothetical protein